MFDILLYLFENYTDFKKQPTREVLTRQLCAVGFVETEIEEALIWLNELKSAEISELKCTLASLRVYADQEICRIGAENLGFIHFLESAGVIDASLREFIIDKVSDLKKPPLEASRFKEIVLIILWGRERNLDVTVVETIISRPALESIH